MTLSIRTPPCIDGESLQEWINEYLADVMPDQTIYLLPSVPHDCTSESSTFLTVDIDSACSKDYLHAKARAKAKGNSAYVSYYAAVCAAKSAGLIDGTYYHVFHKNSH
jgi:hypothetical protein